MTSINEAIESNICSKNGTNRRNSSMKMLNSRSSGHRRTHKVAPPPNRSHSISRPYQLCADSLVKYHFNGGSTLLDAVEFSQFAASFHTHLLKLVGSLLSPSLKVAGLDLGAGIKTLDLGPATMHTLHYITSH